MLNIVLIRGVGEIKCDTVGFNDKMLVLGFKDNSKIEISVQHIDKILIL